MATKVGVEECDNLRLPNIARCHGGRNRVDACHWLTQEPVPAILIGARGGQSAEVSELNPDQVIGFPMEHTGDRPIDAVFGL